MPRARPEPVVQPGDPEFVSPLREEPPLASDIDLQAEAERIFKDDLVDPDDVDSEVRSMEANALERELSAASGLHAKLADLRANFGFIGKTGRNSGVGGGYQFVEAVEVARRFVQEASARNLTMVPVDMRLEEPRPSASGKQVVYTLATVWRITDADSGEFIDVPSFGQGADQADKALPKAQTNAMKYAILLVLQAAGDDPENDPGTDAIENAPQGPGVTAPVVGPSAIEGVRVGGRQDKITQPQLDTIRRHARRLDLSPEAFAILIGSALGGKTVELDDKESTSEQQRAILAFCEGLSHAEGGTLIQTLEAVDTPA